MKALGWYWYTHELAANTVGITFIGEKKKTYKMLHYDERLSREGHYTAYEFGFNLLIEGNLDYQRGRIWWPIVKQMDEAYQRRPRKQITKHSTRMVMNRIGYDFH